MTLHKTAVCVFLFLIAGFCCPMYAKNGAYRSTLHGDPVRGANRRSDAPVGSCMQCHDQHGKTPTTSLAAGNPRLFTTDDNELCLVCHNAPDETGVFPGNGRWTQATHAVIPNSRCTACHDPHGVRDSKGVIPAMLSQREEQLCLTCHDGARASDIRSQLTRTYVHGTRARGTHDPHESGDPASYGAYPVNNRHVTCSDCHNVHQAFKDPAPPQAPDASSRLAGVARVEVIGGGAGVLPRYRWRGPDDAISANEYEICFKCHSSWTRQPTGQPDLARITSADNPSFHPIQARGKNSNIAADAFTTGWDDRSRVHCTDCHGSDDARVRGPHGSSYAYLLKKNSPTETSHQSMQATDLCFDCHAWGVYGDTAAPQDALRASRFNAPSGAGHAFHVGTQQIPCYGCHETHGSMRNAALIATDHPGGVTSYMQTPAGGTCSSSCHASRSYTINYPR